MVQKFQSPVRVYKYPFELVMKAYERRFPTCPQMPIVLDCTITKEEIKDDGAIKHTSRRCKLAVDAPYLLKKVIGLDHVFFIQNNFLDMRARSLNIEATNETYASRVEIFERCRYYAHPENPDWTCFDQTATLDIKNFFGFEHSIEKMGMKQYTQTTLKGREIIEYFIEDLRKEGITHVDRWHGSPVNVENGDDAEANGVCSRKPSVSEYSEMLDGDYILKHFGTLEPMQESKLLQLHDMIKESLGGTQPVPAYSILLRFLRARDFNVDKALQMLQESLDWREENNIDQMLHEYKAPPVITKYFLGAWHQTDKQNCPIYILRLGHMDVKGLLKSIGEEVLLQHALHICEEGLQLIEQASNKTGKAVTNWSLLCDLEGLSMRHLWRPGVKALLKIIETVEKNYPETLGRVFIVRAPRVFPIAWTIVSTFIHENTRSKFLFYGGPDCVNINDGLEYYIDSGIIPDFLGGPCPTLLHEGGIVPKSLYKSLSDDDGVGSPTHDGHHIYQSVDLKPGQIQEVIIKNNDPHSILTWDFDVVRSNLKFTVYRTPKSLPTVSDKGRSIFESDDLEVEKDYYRVEPTLDCHQKESVQGSHVMAHNGNYVLQWICPSTCDTPAQLMFFYEVLSSENYKGSMSNLQPGISAMSLASSCQSR
ncbi:protein real-time [Sitodiplosis mosellana]|uniref:protein real-time n=1 Tax=Sitodiplosis mosellana TaxID=263140 RepID=UPI0024449D48|nr:protein real-time [Sitodiplosis mosellana]